MASYDYDLFTLGAGSGGVRASRMSAQFGARVAVLFRIDVDRPAERLDDIAPVPIHEGGLRV